MDIETRNASIDTMAVTIQALHVSGKQMTLAVFRQLPSVSLFLDSGDRDPSLRWWGTVHYKIRDEGDDWVVADREGLLYRCCTAAPSVEYLQRTVARLVSETESAATNSYVAARRPYLLKELDKARADLAYWLAANKVLPLVAKLPQLFIAV